MVGLSDRKATVYAGISLQTLYNYAKRHKGFLERKEALKERPDIKAQFTVVSQLGDANHAWKWLEKKVPEFKPTQKIEHSGEVTLVQDELTDEQKELLVKIREARRRQIEANIDKLP